MKRGEYLGEFGRSIAEAAHENENQANEIIDALYLKGSTLLADALSRLNEKQLGEVESALNMVGQDIRIMDKLDPEEAEQITSLVNKLALLEDLGDVRGQRPNKLLK